MSAIKLSAIKDPTFDIELPDGQTKSLDLYDLATRIQEAEQASAESQGNFGVRAENLRAAFGFPTRKAVAEATEDPKPYTPSDRQMFHLEAEALERVAELPESKKLLARSRS